jgi:phosphatidylinositol glycan class T
MPTATEAGRWRGWWEGVVDLVPVKGAGSREFSIEKLFTKALPHPFPEAEESVLRLIMPSSPLKVDGSATNTERRWIDGKKREVLEWNLQEQEVAGQNIRFWWDGEGDFQHRECPAYLQLSVS